MGMKTAGSPKTKHFESPKPKLPKPKTSSRHTLFPRLQATISHCGNPGGPSLLVVFECFCMLRICSRSTFHHTWRASQFHDEILLKAPLNDEISRGCSYWNVPNMKMDLGLVAKPGSYTQKRLTTTESTTHSSALKSTIIAWHSHAFSQNKPSCSPEALLQIAYCTV